MCRPKFRNPQSAIRNRPQGLTLVEMLIGMAITLVMMAAVVNLFANLGSGVRVRRAQMELGSQLRIARARLFRDLAGATCPAKTWRQPGSDEGYIEIIDGLWSDSQPSPLVDGFTATADLDYATSAVPSSNLPLASGRVTDGRGLGDKDSVLMLTVRSDNEPFVGRYVNPTTNVVETIESNLAEVIWYLVENPNDGSLGEPGMRTLYRRVLLIAPWVELPTLNVLPGTTKQQKILSYYRNYDVSAQVYQVQPNGTLDADLTTSLVPNALGDLTKRENRFAHSNWDGAGTSIPWPYTIDLNVAFVPFDADNPPTSRQISSMVSPLRPFGRPFETTAATAILDRKGEDVMLSDVLAFDLRVYDPGAPLIDFNGVVLEPSDAGWAVAASNNEPIVGYGAFVNLAWDPSFLPAGDVFDFFLNPKPPRYNYVYANPPVGVPAPLFKEPHAPGWHPRDPVNENAGYNYFATYDTWSTHYESDGIDQDQATDNNAGVDQFGNGLDDDVTNDNVVNPVNGTDDPGERETSPPYDVPLRGMQVKIRVYERDTRQIREATVTRNFVD